MPFASPIKPDPLSDEDSKSKRRGWKRVGFRDTLWPLNPAANDTQHGPIKGQLNQNGQVPTPPSKAVSPVTKVTLPHTAKTAELDSVVDMLLQKKAESARDLYQQSFGTPPATQSQTPVYGMSDRRPSAGEVVPKQPTEKMIPMQPMQQAQPMQPTQQTQPMQQVQSMQPTQQTQPMQQAQPAGGGTPLYVPDSASTQFDYLSALLNSTDVERAKYLRRGLYFQAHEAEALTKRMEQLQSANLGRFGSRLASALIAAGDQAQRFEDAQNAGDPAQIRNTYRRLRQFHANAMHELQRLDDVQHYTMTRGKTITTPQDFLVALTASQVHRRAAARINGRNLLLEKDPEQFRKDISEMVSRYAEEYGFYMNPQIRRQVTDNVLAQLEQDKAFQEERQRYMQEVQSRGNAPSAATSSSVRSPQG